jgi:hypothetical protein
LSLAAGSRRIELQAPGYLPVAFQVKVVMGQVIPYQASLKPNIRPLNEDRFASR